MGNVIFLPVVQNKEWGSSHPWVHYVNDWYNIDEYTGISLYLVAYGNGTGVPRKFWRELRRWMENNLEGEIIIRINDRSGAGFVEQQAYFELESDLTAFKLTWGEYITDE